MFFFTQHTVGVGCIFKSCSCGRQFTANDWLDLHSIGFMDSGDDYTMLDLRNCPCGSTLASEVLIGCDPRVGLSPHLGQQALLAAVADMEERTRKGGSISNYPTLPAPMVAS